MTSASAAAAYRDRILAVTSRHDFTPLMTCYLTDDVDPHELARGHGDGVWVAAKLYPAGATTNSASGVTDIRNNYPALERMQEVGMVFCIHGEVTDPDIDVFDREAVFIDRILTPLVRDFPGLKMVLEHITTRQAAEFVADAPANVAATVTPQHLHLNRNALFKGGLRPHAYCLPVVKREEHRQAVRKAAVSGSPKFFLGTDTAPHSREAKESVMHLDDSASRGDQPLILQFTGHGVDGCALDAQQTSQRFLRQFQAVSATVMGCEQPAGSAGFDRVEAVAGHGLHDLRQQIIGITAEEVAQMSGPALRFFNRLHRHPRNGARNDHFGAGKGRNIAAADNSADRPFTADRRNFDRAIVLQVDDH